MESHQEEVQSPLQTEQQQYNNHEFSSHQGRQTSTFSLTLDEIQQSLNSDLKSFGSMNMDEFLTSLWEAEDNLAQTQPHLAENGNETHFVQNDIEKQLTLIRQGSHTLPEPLCQKTVDEVWSEKRNAMTGLILKMPLLTQFLFELQEELEKRKQDENSGGEKLKHEEAKKASEQWKMMKRNLSCHF